MGFEEASKKYARLLLMVFGSVITGFIYMAPAYLLPEQGQLIIDSRSEWMVIYTMIVIFYFKDQETLP